MGTDGMSLDSILHITMITVNTHFNVIRKYQNNIDNNYELTLSSTVAAIGITSKQSLTASHNCKPIESPNLLIHSLQ